MDGPEEAGVNYDVAGDEETSERWSGGRVVIFLAGQQVD